MHYKLNFGLKTKLIASLGALILVVGLFSAILQAITRWYDTHTFQFNQPIVVDFNAPIEIKDRQIEIKEIVKVINEIPNPVDLKTET